MAQPLFKPRTSMPKMPPARSVSDQAAAGFADIAQGKADPSQTFGPLIDSLKAAQTPVDAPAAPGDSTGATAAPGAQQAITVDIKGTTKLERRAAALVQKYLGVNYVWGGTTPQGFDCSGLIQYVWRSLGVNIPRVTYDQWDSGKVVEGGLKPGDAVFFTGSDAKNGKPGHVGMYIGGGMFIEAPHTGATVRVSKLEGRSDYVGARRFG